MKSELSRTGRLWPALIILAVLVLIGLSGGRYRAAALDPGDCNVVVGPQEDITSIQAAIIHTDNYLVICVKAGVYHEAVNVHAGRPGRTLKAYGDGRPVIDGDKHLPSGSSTQLATALVELNGVGTVFDGFEVRHSSGRAVDVSASNITVRNSIIHDNWGAGIIVRGYNDLDPIDNVVIENNEVYNNILKARHNPVIYRGERAGEGAGDWTFDVDEMWDNPFWSGKNADLPESTVNGLSVTFNNDGVTSRVYAGSVRTINDNNGSGSGHISAEYSANGEAFTYSGRDILFHEPAANEWTKYFKGDAFGLLNETVIDAFQIESAPPECGPACAPILMSFAVTTTVDLVDTTIVTPTITPTAIGPSDLVRFSPTAVNEWDQITAGSFSLYKTAAELGLPPNVNIDALDRTPDGRLLISTAADATIGSLAVDKEDLAVYDETAGTWSLYFDGDQIDYNPFPTDLVAAWLDADGDIYVSASPIGGSALTFIGTKDSVARGNAVYNNYGEGLVADRFSENITLEDNVVYDNYHANLYLNSTKYPLVQRNLAYCTDDPAYMRKGGSKYYTTSAAIQVRDEAFLAIGGVDPSIGQVIINNIVVGCSINFGVSSQRSNGGLNSALVANNVFANARGEENHDGNGVNNISLSSGASYANSSFINNLIVQEPPVGSILRVQGGGADFSTFTVAHNLYYSTNNSLPTTWFPGEVGRVVGAPNLAGAIDPPSTGQAPSVDAFRLTFASPALDAGQATDAADDFFGLARGGAGAYDIGAHELPHAGRIIVSHASLPSEHPQQFDFTATYAPQSFALSDGGQQVVENLSAGTYSVAPTTVAGWTTTGQCDDGSPPDAIVLGPNETVTCSFTSVQAGEMSVSITPSPVSVTDPGGLVSFAVHIDNMAAPVTLTGLTDSAFGNVADAVNSALVSTDCTVPWNLASGGSYDCTFTATVSGTGGSSHASTFTAAGTGPADAPVSATAAVSVAIDYPPPGRIIVTKQTDPPDTSGTLFSFTASFGTFSLGHGQSHDSGPLPPGVAHSVTENGPAGWTVASATCDGGRDPAGITLAPNETVNCTFISSPQAAPAPQIYYITTAKAGTVRELSYSPGDILAYNTEEDAWTLHFDASRVKIAKALNDFVIMDDGSILMAFKAKMKLPAQSGPQLTAMPQDVVRFVPTEVGGWFELFFDGSAVDLAAGSEKIDALAWLDEGPNGTLLISTTGVATVKDADGKNLKAQKEDLLAFRIDQTGEATTRGVWRTYFDGTRMQGMKAENVTSAYVDEETNTLYLTVMNVFTIKGIKGKNNMVLEISSPESPGDVSIYWNAANAGFAKPIDGFYVTP